MNQQNTIRRNEFERRRLAAQAAEERRRQQAAQWLIMARKSNADLRREFHQQLMRQMAPCLAPRLRGFAF